MTVVPHGWRRPDEITSELIEQAKAALPIVEAELDLASPEELIEWLLSLGLLCRANIPEDEARAKIQIYVRMLSVRFMPFPKGVLSPKSLAAAGAKFQFFPSFHELDPFFGERISEVRERCRRIRELSTLQSLPRSLVVTGRRYGELNADEREALERMRRDFDARCDGTVAQPYQTNAQSSARSLSMGAKEIVASALGGSTAIEQGRTSGYENAAFSSTR